MEENISIDALMGIYKAGTLSKKEFEGQIFAALMDDRSYIHLFKKNEDEYDDFLCRLCPVICRAIDSYAGGSFEAYLGSIIFWAALTYNNGEDVSSLFDVAEPLYEGGEAGGGAGFCRPLEACGGGLSREQILILVLKSHCFMTDSFTRSIARTIGMEEAELFRLVRDMKNLRLGRDDGIRALEDKVYGQYYSCMCLEKRLKNAEPDSAQYNKLKRALKKCSKRYEALKEQLNGARGSASNNQIAQVLGIPKGTIDSILYIIKHKFDPPSK
jgi:hypothetical protein